MSPKLKKSLRLIIPLALAVFFGWYTFSKLPLSTIIPFIKSANYWWIALGVFFGLLSHLSRAYRWKYLLEPMGYQIKLPNSVMAVFITYLANYGIPRSGEVLRAAVLTNYEDVPFEKSFGTIVAERIADLLVMLGIITMTLILEFDFIVELLQRAFQPNKLILFGSVGGLILILVFLFINRSQSKFAIKVKTFLKGLMEGMLSIFKMKHKWAFIAHTLFIWGMYVLMFYVTTFALPDLNNVSIGAILVAFISASFTIAATNGGIFVYPVAVMAAFTVFGIAKDPSFAFGWIMWSSQTIMVIIAGSLSFIYLPIYNRTK
ncbi:flippase-like domain-containing protein [Psychroserpens burtonensis]|uniref:Flippase-like domain-containing protein n=1 Tax=Psychroserpens burtonensis TaxID=49278 RepID=A0A5C7B8V5_9FLAO|nr:lysylphosphatidylglycerol synthase transmembrane domain-containing protein [Psychroserpens burtonensis]TXE17803.1 flippase-like domain-containing protein [Psychroserpens burtonensis]